MGLMLGACSPTEPALIGRGTVVEDLSSDLAMAKVGALEGERLSVEMQFDLRPNGTGPHLVEAFRSLSWSVGGLEVSLPGGFLLSEVAFGTGNLGTKLQPTVNGEPGTFLMFIPQLDSDGFPAPGSGPSKPIEDPFGITLSTSSWRRSSFADRPA